MTPENLWYLAALGLLLCGSGFISGSETALFSLRPGQVQAMRERAHRLDLLAVHLLEDGRQLLLTILVANNALNLCFFALASMWSAGLAERGDLSWGGGVDLACLLALIVFAEILPKVLASRLNEVVSRWSAPALRLLVGLCRPLRWLVERVCGGLNFADDPGDRAIGPEEIKLVIEQSHQHGVVSRHVHDRLLEVVDLATTPVFKVMTHRTDCPRVRTTANLDAVVAALRQKPGPYVMVNNANDDCVGILLAHDVLRGGTPKQRMRKPTFVPASATLAQVLPQFRGQGAGVVVVVDEYGLALGLLTLAHVGNELLGAGSSEDLPPAERPEQIDAATWRLPGSMPIDAWRPVLGADADSPDYATLAGFLCRELGAVPEVGDNLIRGNLFFRVERLEGRRIKSVIMRRLSSDEARRRTREMGGRG